MTTMYGVRVEGVEGDRLRVKVIRRYCDLPHLPQARPFFAMLLAQRPERSGAIGALHEATKDLHGDESERFWRERARDSIEWVRPLDAKAATKKGTAGSFDGAAFKNEKDALSASTRSKSAIRARSLTWSRAITSSRRRTSWTNCRLQAPTGDAEVIPTTRGADGYYQLYPHGDGVLAAGNQFHWITSDRVTPITNESGAPAKPSSSAWGLVLGEEVFLPTPAALLRWRAGRVVETLLEGSRNAFKGAARDGDRLWIANSKALFLHQDGQTEEVAPNSRGLPKGKIAQIEPCTGGHLFQVGAKVAFLPKGGEQFEVVKLPKGDWVSDGKANLFITSDKALHRVRHGVAERIAEVPGVCARTSATLLDEALWLLSAGVLWRIGSDSVRSVAELQLPGRVRSLRRFGGALWACSREGVVELRHGHAPRWYVVESAGIANAVDVRPVGESHMCLFVNRRDTPLQMEVRTLDALRAAESRGGDGPILNVPELEG
ncbi:MAG: hypothetical protein AB8I08_21535 [Sandaracinaceae bacterium]